MTKRCFLTALTMPLWVGLPLAAQAPIAFVNARILTMTDAGTIEAGTIVVRDGRISAVGADVKAPPGAQVVDVAGGTVMPGLVHAWSRAGTQSGRPTGPSMTPPAPRGRGGRGEGGGGSPGPGAVNRASTKIADGLYDRLPIFGELLREGVTTLVVHPEATGFAGLAARLAPNVGPEVPLTIADEVYLVVDPAPSPKAGKAMKDALDAAQKVLDERRKPKEEPKPAEPAKADAEARPAAGGEAKTGEQPKPAEKPKEGEQPKEGEKPAQDPKAEAAKPAEKKPEPKKDPNVEVLADLLDGKRRTFLRLSTAMEIQHYRAALKDHDFEAVLVADEVDPRSGLLSEELEWLRKRAKIVLTQPNLQQVPNTRVLLNPPAELVAAGFELGFVLGDDPRQIRGLMFDLMELVRCGLPAEHALRAVTAVPAKALGLEAEVGSIAEGRRADLLVFTGDPLDPTSRLRSVYLEGHATETQADR
jgi:hypothetical protein